MDDWIYPALSAGCPELCDELFEIEYNRNSKVFAPGVSEKDVKKMYGNASGLVFFFPISPPRSLPYPIKPLDHPHTLFDSGSNTMVLVSTGSIFTLFCRLLFWIFDDVYCHDSLTHSGRHYSVVCYLSLVLWVLLFLSKGEN